MGFDLLLFGWLMLRRRRLLLILLMSTWNEYEFVMCTPSRMIQDTYIRDTQVDTEPHKLYTIYPSVSHLWRFRFRQQTNKWRHLIRRHVLSQHIIRGWLNWMISEYGTLWAKNTDDTQKTCQVRETIRILNRSLTICRIHREHYTRNTYNWNYEDITYGWCEILEFVDPTEYRFFPANMRWKINGSENAYSIIFVFYRISIKDTRLRRKNKRIFISTADI